MLCWDFWQMWSIHPRGLQRVPSIPALENYWKILQRQYHLWQIFNIPATLTNRLSLSNPLQWTIPSSSEWSGLLGPLLVLTIAKVRGYWHGWTQLIQKCKFIQGNVLSLIGGLPCFTKIFKVIPPNTQCLNYISVTKSH